MNAKLVPGTGLETEGMISGSSIAATCTLVISWSSLTAMEEFWVAAENSSDFVRIAEVSVEGSSVTAEDSLRSTGNSSGAEDFWIEETFLEDFS